MSNFLTKEEIFAADDIKSEVVHVPEWGGDVRVKAMTGAERDAFEQSITTRTGKVFKSNMENVRAKLCAFTIVDEAGNLLFKEREIEQLGAKSAAVLDRVFTVAQRLAGLSDADVEDLATNFENGQLEPSTSS